MASSFIKKSVQDIFTSACLSIIETPVTDENLQQPTSSILKISNDSQLFSTSSYFLDETSRRSKVAVPILIAFENQFERTKVLKSGAIQPPPLKQNEEAKEIIDANVSMESNESDLWGAELDMIGETHGDEQEHLGKMEIKFQCLCLDNDSENDENQGDDTVIEGVKIISTSLIDTVDQIGIRFDLEIGVRCCSLKQSDSDVNSDLDSTRLETELLERSEKNIARTQLEITAILSLKDDDDENVLGISSRQSSPRHLEEKKTDYIDDDIDLQLGLQALDMGMEAISPQDPLEMDKPNKSYFSKSSTYSLPSPNVPGPKLNLSILPAFLVSVREISSASSTTGVTLVSLVIYHSNVHNENVTITNIALHPGHSRLYIESSTKNHFSSGVSETTVNSTKAMLGGEDAVINMTKSVRWGYASGTAPALPLILKPHEAVATVLQINANEIMMERVFVSPICIRAAVGEMEPSEEEQVPHSHSYDTFRTKHGKSASTVMVTTDTRWNTAPIAVGSTDAFRVSLSINESVCNVGAQVVVSLKILNLSTKPKDLMLMMAKTESGKQQESEFLQKGDVHEGISYVGGNMKTGASTIGMSGASAGNSKETQNTNIENEVNNPVVSLVNGYTFGCYGLVGDDDGTIRYARDHDLLAVDAILLLGEVKGQLATEAELRFVPLREGPLAIPNLQLYDKYEDKWYDCFHTLKIVAMSKK